MENCIYREAIEAIMDSQSVGYSFVKTFIDALWKNKGVLCINNYVMLWHVLYGSKVTSQFFASFSNEQEFDIFSLDIEKMMEEVCPLDSSEESFQAYFLNDTFKSSHIIAIPINAYSHDSSFFEAKGLLLLFSQQGSIQIESDELKIFHILLNRRKPNVNNDIVNDSLNNLAIAESKSTAEYTECFQCIGKSLDEISNKNTDCARLYGLRHFSLWNFIHANVDLKAKSFSRNTYRDVAHSNTHTMIFDDVSHFINEAVSDYKAKEGVQILRCLSFNEGKASFKEEEYFEENGLSEKNTTIIVAADGDSELNYDYPDRILNFYISNIVYTPFISISFVELFSKSITNSIRKSLVTCRDKMLTDLMNASMWCSKEEDFYRAVATIVKKANEAADVLIYQKDKEKFELKNSGNSVTKKIGELEVPYNFAVDQGFIGWLQSCLGKFENAFYVNDGNTEVSSAAYMRTEIDEAGRTCIMVLINKHHQPSTSCVYYNNIFDKDNYYITEPCGVFLVQYQIMQDSIKSKNYLLHKLRHEIPSCTEAIGKGLNDIKNMLGRVDFSRKHILNIANNLALNNSRVLLLAQFFSTVDFDAQRFAKDKIDVNIISFLSSYIDIFRTEGIYKGVDVYYYLRANRQVYVNASNFFQLALVNVVTNAIRYAASGTCVFIEVFEDQIVVRDLGIGIPDDEKELIFKEGYRGREAKKVNEKGMGYGLYLTRKVLEAHDFDINVESSLYFDKNYFAESALLIYLDTLALNDRKRFIQKGIGELDIPNVLKYFDEVKESRNIIEIGKGYANLRLDTIKSWMSYLSNNNVVFYDMAQELFQEELYEVTFTINI